MMTHTQLSTPTPTVIKSQKHPFHILDASPFPFLTGPFLATRLVPLTFLLRGSCLLSYCRSSLRCAATITTKIRPKVGSVANLLLAIPPIIPADGAMLRILLSTLVSFMLMLMFVNIFMVITYNRQEGWDDLSGLAFILACFATFFPDAYDLAETGFMLFLGVFVFRFTVENICIVCLVLYCNWHDFDAEDVLYNYKPWSDTLLIQWHELIKKNSIALVCTLSVSRGEGDNIVICVLMLLLSGVLKVCLWVLF